jgi:DUF2934 family protein
MIVETVSPAFVIVSADDIAARAYELYAERNYVNGFDREDWLQAEGELRAPRPADQSTTRLAANGPPGHAEHV